MKRSLIGKRRARFAWCWQATAKSVPAQARAGANLADAMRPALGEVAGRIPRLAANA